MNALQKVSVYNLAVCALFFAAWAALYTLFGMRAAMPVFALMGLLGFGAFFMGGGKERRVASDERSRVITERAAVAGIRVFWLYFAVCLVVVSMRYETIPLELFLTVSVFGLFIFTAGTASAALLLESMDTPRPPGLVEAFRELDNFQKMNLMVLLIYCLFMLPAVFNFPVEGPVVISLAMTAVFFALFFLSGVKQLYHFMNGADELAFERARAFSRKLLAALVPGALVLAWVADLASSGVTAGHYLLAAFLAVCAAILAQPVASIAFAGHRQTAEQGASQ